MATKRRAQGTPGNVINAAALEAEPAVPTEGEQAVVVYHPAFKSVSTEVKPSDVDRWAAAGWRRTPLKD